MGFQQSKPIEPISHNAYYNNMHYKDTLVHNPHNQTFATGNRNYPRQRYFTHRPNDQVLQYHHHVQPLDRYQLYDHYNPHHYNTEPYQVNHCTICGMLKNI